MTRTFRSSQGPSPNERLARALERLDALVDWERRDRSAGSGRAMRVDLAPAAALTDRLGRPQDAFHAVHVAGSKGKGSTAHAIAGGLGAAGLRVGLYTSPHVERLNERIVVAGDPVDDEALAAALEAALAAREAGAERTDAASRATWFDVLTAAAFWHFRASRCELAVVECGLGGRLDSTNVVRPALCVVTTIALEHTAILGDDRATIAAEKAGILAPGVPAIAADARVSSAVGNALRNAAALARTSLVDVPGARAGRIAERNRALADAALERLGRGGLRGRDGRPVGARLVSDPARAGLPGRLERQSVAGVPVVLDGAHVPSSLRLVLQDLDGAPGLSGPLVCVFGCGKDKDALGLLKTLAPWADRTLCTRAGDGPYADPEELSALAAELGSAAEPFDDAARALSEALRLAGRLGGWVLVTGSLHLVGALRSATREPSC